VPTARTNRRPQLHGLARLRRNWLRAFLPAALAVVLLAGAALAALEADTAHSFGAGVLWALSLMMTVGFTGGVPHTVAGKVLSGVLMVLGFGLLALTTAAIASLFVREDEIPEEQRELDFKRDAMAQLAVVAARLDRIERRLIVTEISSSETSAIHAPPRPG
jgi:voltage-gated potassium channel